MTERKDQAAHMRAILALILATYANPLEPDTFSGPRLLWAALNKIEQCHAMSSCARTKRCARAKRHEEAAEVVLIPLKRFTPCSRMSQEKLTLQRWLQNLENQ